MNEPSIKALTNRATWRRALYILMFAVILGLTRLVLGGVVVLQFIIVLFTGQPNERLLNFGQSLSTYVYLILLFVTFNSDERPYPFAPWPQGGSRK